jgi:N-hydroxyarylamine O-acetyltransferase
MNPKHLEQAPDRGARVAEYLERMGYDGPRDATAETLGRLHHAHLLAVPFENLDIHLGRPIVLDLDAIFDKVVRRRRGGFCYELNGLFGWLLGELGFDVTMVSARVANERGELSPEFDHMALLVRLDRVWLADVGFGTSSREPLALDDGGEQYSDGVAYSVARDGDGWLMVGRDENCARPEYRFTELARRLDEYEPMCRYHQTSPDSHFTRNRICSLATPDGRVTLSCMRLIVTRGGERTERELADEAEYAATLRGLFGVEL